MEKSPVTTSGPYLGKTSSVKERAPEYLTPTNTTFSGPVKTLGDLRQALIQQFGPEQGKKMYDQFYSSILIMCFGTVHKESDRAQRAAKKMRSAYKNH
ncbi:hypothetical protein [Chlamydiifrater phoenicopteri]|uniref:hypothetical protein n=1 Tax=Chlamydiifrater phoenicopteri TaxID=2681469 RepID=UPI001BCD0B8C|nr:hypothetical protein [Chlamydiifrater phoenicopteri]